MFLLILLCPITLYKFISVNVIPDFFSLYSYHDRITLVSAYEGIPFIGFGYKCDGSEDSVSECTIRAPVHDPMNVKPMDIIAVQCGAGPNQGRGR